METATPPKISEQYYDRVEIEAQAQDLLNSRENLPSAEVRHQERRDNARTALMEALTASGHLSCVEISGTLDEINHQVLSRLLNGWDDTLPFHEKQRRFAELCNELMIQQTHRLIVQGDLPSDTLVMEISDYPSALDDSQATALGYRCSNKKGMVRSTGLQYFGDGQFTRVIEQGSRSNGTWDSTSRFFAEMDIPTDTSRPADIRVLQAPFIIRQVDAGVVSIMRRLDELAGANIRYGEVFDEEKHTAYEKLHLESARREGEVGCYIDELAKLEEQLEQMQTLGQIPRAEQLEIYKEEVDRILSAICILRPSYAEDTFGKEAATRILQATEMESRGDSAGAASMMTEAHHYKETVTFCGVSISVEQAQQEGMAVNSLGQLIAKGKEFWQWKDGKCRIDNCPTRPKSVKVGPCEVCVNCQTLYDRKKNPRDTYTAANKIGQQALSPFQRWNQEYDAKLQQKKLQKLAQKKSEES